MKKTSPPRSHDNQVYRLMGLLKYDCPTASCSAWFVTFDPINVRCEECGQRMIDTEVL